MPGGLCHKLRRRLTSRNADEPRLADQICDQHARLGLLFVGDVTTCMPRHRCLQAPDWLRPSFVISAPLQAIVSRILDKAMGTVGALCPRLLPFSLVSVRRSRYIGENYPLRR